MTLRRLELQGYKSFASHVEFSFDGGITAIVGPNGSGKSNIADAIRWVLGEQSYSLLRAKRTEDLIYSGSSRRPRLGFAEVSLVLDNSHQWLPIDYEEIRLTRRAYRSGENEYLINGGRVRLRDIVELLSRGGLGPGTSAVIGQGQIDAALSLRPDERRSLFEEAAGIRVHIAKRDEALARLEETHRNIERLNDIVNEIAPRLGSLRRQAERTQEHDTVRQQLNQALLTWYGFQWQRLQERAARSEHKLASQTELVQGLREQVQANQQKRETARARQQTLREEIRRHRLQAEQLRTLAEDARRRLAVSVEQARATQRHREQLEADLAGINARRVELETAIARHEEALAQIAAALTQQQEAVANAKARLAAAEAQLHAQRAETERARTLAFEVATAQAGARNRLAHSQRRKADLEQEVEQQQTALTETEARATTAAEELARCEMARNQARQVLTEAEASLQKAEERVSEATSQIDRLRAARDAARDVYQRLATQHDVLQRTRSQAAHLHEGTQAVLSAGLPGVLGTVASLIQVPAELEVAIEASLGAHLEDVVVKTWSDALTCIELLKRRDRGRATFLPLDYVRSPRPIPAPQVKGVRGIASRLVESEPTYRGICELLLGSIVIVNDLPAARAALAAEARLGRAVTIDGDVVEARGVVRGGSRPRSRGTLALEREWRELPERLNQAQGALAQAEAALRSADQNLQQARHQLQECTQQLQSARRNAEEHEQRASLLQQRHDRLAQELSWRRSLLDQARRNLAAANDDLAQLDMELATLDRQHMEATQRLESLRLAGDSDELQSLQQQLGESETALAVAMRSQQAQEELLAAQRESLARTDAEGRARQEQLARVQADADSLAKEIAQLRQNLEQAHNRQRAAAEPISQAEAELQTLEQTQLELETADENLRQQLQTQQMELSRLTFERDHIREEQEDLKRQMEADLGPVDLPESTQPRQLLLNLGDALTPLPAVTALPEGLTSRVKELRSALRRLGPVNPEAPAEYAQVLERHQFLVTQIADLNRAADATRQVVDELNQLIRDRFAVTFERVAREFSTCFGTLFNGGTARLVLTEPGNPAASGIEILARPPGKRTQSLALLSGGERALTAAALLFALLRVNPLPFCVLDEVDAMLDEANVHRFRDLLRSLAERTQFVVITHNRSTIEAASTVYGISMGREGASQVLSLTLPQKEAAPA